MKQRNGFTLIEMLIVISIIGLLAALIAPKLLNHYAAAKRTKAFADIQTLSQALELYTLHNGKPPTTEQGLKALVQKPAIEPIPQKWIDGGYLSKKIIPKDPWGHDYVYISPGLNDPEFDIISYGSDGVAGGTGNAADLESWNLEGNQPAK